MCGKWTHAKCCGVSPEEYLRLSECEDELYGTVQVAGPVSSPSLTVTLCRGQQGLLLELSMIPLESLKKLAVVSRLGVCVSGHLVVCHLNIRSLVF